MSRRGGAHPRLHRRHRGERLRFSGEPISARFLADDRRTLLPPETQLTGGSGIAIVGEVEVAVGGICNRDYWRPTGVLFADNWVFMEFMEFMESLDLTPPPGQ